ncbi:MAG: pyridoxamine 5'-phosphate oxidase family protein [Oscillospiraceae bacterium]|nr:pyridoxamine 5'-phosphate oxidase family protein [Oscillospiraceae bacterium]
MTDSDIIAIMEEIVRANTVGGGAFKGQVCTLALIDEDGFPTSAVLTPSKSDGIRWLTFGTLLDENRAIRSSVNNRASVCFGSAAHCVNLVGEIQVVTDADVKREMWYDALNAFFIGPDDPNYCVLKFVTKRYKFFRAKDGIEVADIL